MEIRGNCWIGLVKFTLRATGICAFLTVVTMPTKHVERSRMKDEEDEREDEKEGRDEPCSRGGKKRNGRLSLVPAQYLSTPATNPWEC